MQAVHDMCRFLCLEVLAFGVGLFCGSQFKWMSCVNLVDLDHFSNREVDEEAAVLQIHGVACGVFFAVFCFMICHLCNS